MLWKTDVRQLQEEIREGKRAVEGLRDRLDSLERQPKLLQVEWESTLDKIGRVMARLNARIRKADELGDVELPQTPPESQPAPEAVPTLGSHRTLRMARSKHGLLPR